jgi:hypothetical protein
MRAVRPAPSGFANPTRPAVLSLGPAVHPAVHLRGSDARRLLPERRGWCPRPLAFGGDPCCGALLRGWPRPRCGRLRPRARTFSVGSRPGPPRIWHGHRDARTYFSRTGHARVAELADAVDSKSTDESLVGSTPTPGTSSRRRILPLKPRRRGKNPAAWIFISRPIVAPCGTKSNKFGNSPAIVGQAGAGEGVGRRRRYSAPRRPPGSVAIRPGPSRHDAAPRGILGASEDGKEDRWISGTG